MFARRVGMVGLLLVLSLGVRAACLSPESMLENPSNEAWVNPECVKATIGFLDAQRKTNPSIYRTHNENLITAQRFFQNYYKNPSLQDASYLVLGDMYNYIMYRRGEVTSQTKCRTRTVEKQNCCILHYKSPAGVSVTKELNSGKAIVDAYACRNLSPKATFCTQDEQIKAQVFGPIFAESVCLIRLAEFASSSQVREGNAYWSELFSLVGLNGEGPVGQAFIKARPYERQVLKEIFPSLKHVFEDLESSTSATGQGAVGAQEANGNGGQGGGMHFFEYKIGPFKEDFSK